MIFSLSTRCRNVLFYWLPVMLYCLLIFIQSSYPPPESIPDYPHMDKVLHTAAYAVLAILFFRAFNRMDSINQRPLLVMILSIAAATAYGISDEIHQHYVPYRSADIVDAAADAVGSILGATGHYLYFFFYNRNTLDRHPSSSKDSTF